MALGLNLRFHEEDASSEDFEENFFTEVGEIFISKISEQDFAGFIFDSFISGTGDVAK